MVEAMKWQEESQATRNSKASYHKHEIRDAPLTLSTFSLYLKNRKAPHSNPNPNLAYLQYSRKKPFFLFNQTAEDTL